jgi:hypothetical protein
MIFPFLFECRSLVLILERYVMGDYLLPSRCFQCVSEIKPVLFSALGYDSEPTRWVRNYELIAGEPS